MMERACPDITHRKDRHSVFVNPIDPHANDDRQVVVTVHMRIHQEANLSTEGIIKLLIKSDEKFASQLQDADRERAIVMPGSRLRSCLCVLTKYSE